MPSEPDTTSPISLSRPLARQIIEVLGSTGTPPTKGVQHFNVGNGSLLDALDRFYLSSYLQDGGAAFKLVVGDYGSGKSHFLYCLRDVAWARGFAVAKVDLSPIETPYNDQKLVYGAVARNLIWHESNEAVSDEQGLPRFLAGTLERVTGQNLSLETLTHPNYRGLVDTLEATPIDSPPYRMAFLLSGLSSLAKLAGYSGLCVLIDEAESYSLLYPYQRPKAGLFFSAAIHAALRERSLIVDDSLPQHRFRDYPTAYSTNPNKQALLFLFTVTRSDNRLPLEDWLTDEQILELDPHYSPQEVGQFLSVLQNHHAQAYGYEPGERQGQIRRAAEHLSGGAQRGLLSPRSVVRLATELYDLLYLNPELEVAALLEELRQQLRS